jgi:hypothetical protein
MGAGTPTDGMAAILAGYGGAGPASVAEPVPAASPAPPAAGDDSFAAIAGLGVQLGTLSQQLAAASGGGRRRRPTIPMEYCHPLDLPPDQLAAAGILDRQDKFGPKTGWIWHITRLTITGLAGATTLQVYKDSVADPSMLANSFTGVAPALFVWEPRLLLLMPNRKLVFNGIGGGYTVCGEGVEIATPWIAEYLM